MKYKENKNVCTAIWSNYGTWWRGKELCDWQQGDGEAKPTKAYWLCLAQVHAPVRDGQSLLRTGGDSWQQFQWKVHYFGWAVVVERVSERGHPTRCGVVTSLWLIFE